MSAIPTKPNALGNSPIIKKAKITPTIDLYALIGPNTESCPFSSALTINPLPSAPQIPPTIEYTQKSFEILVKGKSKSKNKLAKDKIA